MAIMSRVPQSKSSSMETKYSEEVQESLCVVCFKGVNTYSIGQCDHPVCYECSTRMRVLCRKFECPICRQDMPTVVFTKHIRPFKLLKGINGPFDSHSKITFETEEVQYEFCTLLEHRCPKCPQVKTFSKFEHLRDHVKRSHQLSYCDLCVDNLKIFTHERRVYSRGELSVHRRHGDPDDTSHRGHPLCEFCDVRYVDTDELYRHLRKDHLYCHICDADGFHRYYSSYSCLRDHFRKEHFLCEEGDCSEEKFTSVFRTEIDLRAHRASEHGRNMGKSELKQARTLNLEFNLAPRPRGGPSRSRQHYRDEELVDGMTPVEEVEAALAQQVQQIGLNTACPAEFPSLTPGAPSSHPMVGRGNGRFAAARSQARSACYEADFPALAAAQPPTRPATSSNPSSRQSVAVHPPRNTASGSAHSFRPAASPHQSLAVHIRSSGSSSGGNKKTFLEDFPALSPLPSNVQAMAPSGSQWAVAPRAVEPKVQLVARPTVSKSRSQAFCMDSSQFPSLGGVSNPPTAPPEPRRPPPTCIESRPPEPPPVVHQEKEKHQRKKKKGKKEDQKNNSNDVPLEANNNLSRTNNIKNNNNTRINSSNNINNSSDGDLRGRPVNGGTPAPPGFTAPPGFGGQRPPPGLVPPPSLTTFSYLTPRNFTKRNKRLLSEVVESLGGAERLDDFRRVSAAFRAGSIPASEYVSHCAQAMGFHAFDSLFPELLALLPDIEKQKELWLVVDSDIRQRLERCEVCQQVVATADVGEHAASHAAQIDFPPLGPPPLSRPLFQSQST